MDDQAQSSREKPTLAGAILSSSKLLSASCPNLLDIDNSSSFDSAIVMDAQQRESRLSLHISNPLKRHERRKASLPSVVTSSRHLSPPGGVHCLRKLGAMMKHKSKYLNRLPEGGVGGMFGPTEPPPVCILLTRAGEEEAYQLEENRETGELTTYHKLLEGSVEKVGTLLYDCLCLDQFVH